MCYQKFQIKYKLFATKLQPLVLTPTPVAAKDSRDASKRTIQKRNSFIKGQIVLSSKSVEYQTGKLVRSFGTEERTDILKSGSIHAHIEAEELVAMKANLGLPWEKMKSMARLERHIIIFYI